MFCPSPQFVARHRGFKSHRHVNHYFYTFKIKIIVFIDFNKKPELISIGIWRNFLLRTVAANVTFDFTPTGASWLNQVEIWFDILTRQALDGASFANLDELVHALYNHTAKYNEAAHLFKSVQVAQTRSQRHTALQYGQELADVNTRASIQPRSKNNPATTML